MTSDRDRELAALSDLAERLEIAVEQYKAIRAKKAQIKRDLETVRGGRFHEADLVRIRVNLDASAEAGQRADAALNRLEGRRHLSVVPDVD